jgi:hypothetical protein
MPILVPGVVTKERCYTHDSFYPILVRFFLAASLLQVDKVRVVSLNYPELKPRSMVSCAIILLKKTLIKSMQEDA